ncbi:unnamed protein product [Penicillium glandicola]
MKRLYRKLLRRRRNRDGSDGAELPPSEAAPEAGEPPKAPKPVKGPAGPAKGPAGPPKGLAGPPKGLAGPPKGLAVAPEGPAEPAKPPARRPKGLAVAPEGPAEPAKPPGKVQKPSGPKKKVTKPPKPVKAPKPAKDPKAGKASRPAAPQKGTIASDGNDSDKEDPLSTKDKPDDDIDMPDADPGDELESDPSRPAGEGETQGSSSSPEWFGGAKRTLVEEPESVSQESGTAKRPRIGTTKSTHDLTAEEISMLRQGVPNPGSRKAPSGPKSPRVDTSLDSTPANSDDELNFHTPTQETVDKWRKKGAQLQAWLEDPIEPNCNIAPATATVNDLTDQHVSDIDRFRAKLTYFQDPDDLLDGGESELLGLPTTGCRYRYSHVENVVQNEAILRKYNRRYLVNNFVHMMGPGIIVGKDIARYDNVQWNVLARALLGRIFASEAYGEKLVKLERDTPEFHELLGTKLGKAAAILLISSFPRGTRRISWAVIWNRNRALQVRFEVEATGEGQEIERITTPPPTPKLVPNPEPRHDSDDEGETEHVELAD